jgi:hypothetical protein
VTVRIAALEYERLLTEVCDGKLTEHLIKDQKGWSPFGVPAEVMEQLRTLRVAAVKEYADALEADEKQRITEKLKGW